MRSKALQIAFFVAMLGCGDRTGLLIPGEAPASIDAGPIVTIVPTVSGSSSSGGGSEDGEACPDESLCGSQCVDLQSDPNDCGQCGTTCATGALCRAGACTCPGTESLCNDTCVDEQGDANHCGGCGNTCTGATPFCSSGVCVAPPPGCQPGGPGLTDCGPSGTESCCTTGDVVGGTFFRTYDEPPGSNGWGLAPDGGPTAEADPATVSSFRLDRYLVTVGRFRQFVGAWNAGYTPPAGAGKHAHLNGGNGLNAAGRGYEPGWVESDNSNVTPTNDNLNSTVHSCDVDGTWTASPGSHESLPINCVNWQEAYAFCIWDGGFLPTEAEWEYAVAGGSEQRVYPWGSTDPGTNNEYAIDACQYPSPATICADLTSVAPVGTATLGAGRWGQLDLQGEVWEWNLDWYNDYVDPWTDAANLSPSGGRVVRGGSDAWDGAGQMDSQARYDAVATGRWRIIGFRCARAP